MGRERERGSEIMQTLSLCVGIGIPPDPQRVKTLIEERVGRARLRNPRCRPRREATVR